MPQHGAFVIRFEAWVISTRDILSATRLVPTKLTREPNDPVMFDFVLDNSEQTCSIYYA